MTLISIKSIILNRLSPLVGAAEAKAMTDIILEDIAGVDRINAALHPDRELEPETAEKVENTVARIVNGEPLQYVTGTALFHGLRLHVAPGVLIPRPETSQLVDIIVDTVENQKDLKILDIGTGSGAIALALARALPFCLIDALDISSRALEIARINGENLKVKNVRWLIGDILDNGITTGSYDVIVSNPPYVTMSEASDMDARVLDYEPHEALFVPDNDPLRFYSRISEDALTSLSPCGWLFFEINPLYSAMLRNLLETKGYHHVEILKDFCGRDRFIKASRY